MSCQGCGAGMTARGGLVRHYELIDVDEVTVLETSSSLDELRRKQQPGMRVVAVES